MPAQPDPGSPPPTDRWLAVGLVGLLAAIALLAYAIHRFVPSPGGEPMPATSNPPASPAPLLTRPQLLEDQQAMPEMADFDAQTPPPAALGGGGLGLPPAPGAAGSGGPGQ